MEFIKKTKEEEELCNHYLTTKRENSEKIDYFNKINDKPWGKEYLAYQNKHIGIWILHVNCDQETSLHCHFKKDTILIPLTGSFKINLHNDYRILNVFDSLFVPRCTFHGIHSYVNNGILMEIEVYTENIEYTDKNDLLRIKDMYLRDKDKYETSVLERVPNENEIMQFMNQDNYWLDKTNISIFKTNILADIEPKYDKVLLLNGCLYTDGKRITSGSFIDLNTDYSLLTEEIEVLCMSNIYYKYINKVVYSKNHLTDLLLKTPKNNIGLTCGCFDILHEGHITNLKMCRKKCDELYVCLSSDEQIARLKGKSRPINKLNDRIHMLIHYDFIDLVILYNETNDEYQSELDNVINLVNPNIWFKGSDYTKEDIFKKHPSLKNIEIIDLVEGKSTTNIINKIKYYMKICFYNTYHIGDLYMASFFLRIICGLNLDIDFYYYTINGDVFFENIPNIKRLNNIEPQYNEHLINGSPPENLVNSAILKKLYENNMVAEGAKIIKIDNEDVLFINTWCNSEYLNHRDFDIMSAMHSYKNLIQNINTQYNLSIRFTLEHPRELLKDIQYYNQLFFKKYAHIDLNDTIFIFNYVARSAYFDINILNNYISELSNTNKVLLASYDSIFENNPNIKYIDKDYNIIPNPSCSNLIEIWEIAIKCNKIIIAQTGGSWTFLHKYNQLKENQLFMFGGQYVERLNNNINQLLGENKNLIKPT
jgi:rfaE bifunctional protein nucleotidyltransferase chain/domain